MAGRDIAWLESCMAGERCKCEAFHSVFYSHLIHVLLLHFLTFVPHSHTQTEYCWTAPKGPSVTLEQSSLLGVGGAGPAQLLKMWNVLEQPLQSRPGTQYAYVNANWIIAAYIIEQVDGVRKREACNICALPPQASALQPSSCHMCRFLA